MIKFRQRNYSIQEGHYTGPKDQNKVPGTIEVLGKSALGGMLAGAGIGHFLKDSDSFEGAWTGGKYGTLAGIALKLFINYLHKPMKDVKFQEVDKLIRREFGIYRMTGITVGDSIDKRATLDEKFSFNDRNVTGYKLNFSVQNNRVTMYTFGITQEELSKIDKVLDYYCKKYFGMEYSATSINPKVNSYAVQITFTNYQVISNFIMELSGELETRINLLDCDAIVSRRISEESSEEEEKNFSVAGINRYDIIKILGNGARRIVPGSIKSTVSSFVIGLITGTILEMSKEELAKAGLRVPRETLNNSYLKNALKKLHCIEGFHYTVGPGKDSELNISMANGMLIMTSSKEMSEKLDKNIWQGLKSKITRNDTGKAVVYTYSTVSHSELNLILSKLVSMRENFNVFEK